MARSPISAPTAGTPGGVDDDVDQIIVDDQAGIVGDGDLAASIAAVIARRSRLRANARFLDRRYRRPCWRIGQVQFGNGADLDARHMRHAGDDVGAHLARADQADADRTARIRTRLHVPRQSRQCYIARHPKNAPHLTSVAIPETILVPSIEY
jgi:hypothetical protein